MNSFDKAWNLVKEIKDGLVFVPTEQWEAKKEDEDTKLKDALEIARKQKKKPLPKNLGGMVRTGSDDDKMGC